MRYSKRFVVFILSLLFIAGTFVISASAQTRGKTSAGSGQKRPVIVRRVIYRDPFWRSRYWGDPFWGYGRYYSPHIRYREQQYYLESRVLGNRSELEKHKAKYSADGVITAKEQEELDDDYRDLQESIEELREFNREG